VGILSNLKQLAFLAVFGVVLYSFLNWDSISGGSLNRNDSSLIEAKLPALAESILYKYGRKSADECNKKADSEANSQIALVNRKMSLAYLQLCLSDSYKRAVKNLKISFDSESKAVIRFAVAITPNPDLPDDKRKLFRSHEVPYEFQATLRKFDKDWEVESFEYIGSAYRSMPVDY